MIAAERQRRKNGEPPLASLMLRDELIDSLNDFRETRPPRAINGTGVILHTNLGRAPWARRASEAALAAMRGYVLLELDAETGRRSRRFRLAEERLMALTGAEDALVVSNNAAAVMLAARVAGRGRGVAVARGELVEIGGGVRIPDVLRSAGLRLVEVGTTNKTRLRDYEEPLAAGRAAVVLRVHASNFRMTGFVERPESASLAALARRFGAVVVDDIGSGALLDTAKYGLAHEPTAQESLDTGADLVTFSGDKLLGGPQSGLIIGRAELVARIRRDPLARATRPDKVVLVALAATLGAYQAGTAEVDLPVWQMISVTAEELRTRSHRVCARVLNERSGLAIEVAALSSTVGGGSLPGETLASFGLSIDAPHLARFAKSLRLGRPAVIARLADDRLLLDMRTVLEDEVDQLPAAIVGALDE